MNISASTSTPAGWFADPWHDYTYRYWDGDRWTGLVSAHEWQPRPAHVSGTWWDASKAVWGFAGYGVDLKSRDLSFTATRFESAVPYRERAQAAQAHRSMWRARRVLKSGVSDFASSHAYESIRFIFVRWAIIGITIAGLVLYLESQAPRYVFWAIAILSIAGTTWEQTVRARAALYALNGKPYRYLLTTKIGRR